jgi:transglutaminase-like putative cysteine protease
MTRLAIKSRLSYVVEHRTSFAFSIAAARTPFQVVTGEQIDISVDVPWTAVPYGEGTHQLVRFTVDPCELDVTYEASVSVNGHGDLPADLDEVPFDEIPADILPFLNPSRYCESDKLGGFAWRQFGDAAQGYDRVSAVSNWVNTNLVYEAGSTDGSSGTTDVLIQRAGVCRDFAHVAISLCWKRSIASSRSAIRM